MQFLMLTCVHFGEEFQNVSMHHGILVIGHSFIFLEGVTMKQDISELVDL
jgi:hypothetical protein